MYRWFQRIFWIGLAAGPLAWALLPALLSPQRFPGLPSTDTYIRLHAWWALSANAAPVLGFPGQSAPPVAEALAGLLLPLISALGPVLALKSTLLIDACLSGLCASRWLRGRDPWIKAAAIAAFLASPATLTEIANGSPDALRAWAALFPLLNAGTGALALGAVAGLCGPSWSITAIIGLLFSLSQDESPWPTRLKNHKWSIAGVASMLGVSVLSGWPKAIAPVTTWFQHALLSPDPEHISAIYVGYAIPLLILVGLGGPGRRYSQMALLAFAIGAVHSPFIPARLLALLPFYALLSVGSLIEKRAPTALPAGMVLLGALVVGEGWKGVSVDLPLAGASLEIPAAVKAIPLGPVLDLPATRSAAPRALFFQIFHQQPIAVSADGLVPSQVDQAVRSLSSGRCPDLEALGFHSLLVRREQQFLALAPVVACYGAATVDDGKIALWTRLSPAPTAP